jgi:hypothetical protein
MLWLETHARRTGRGGATGRGVFGRAGGSGGGAAESRSRPRHRRGAARGWATGRAGWIMMLHRRVVSVLARGERGGERHVVAGLTAWCLCVRPSPLAGGREHCGLSQSIVANDAASVTLERAARLREWRPGTRALLDRRVRQADGDLLRALRQCGELSRRAVSAGDGSAHPLPWSELTHGCHASVGWHPMPYCPVAGDPSFRWDDGYLR